MVALLKADSDSAQQPGAALSICMPRLPDSLLEQPLTSPRCIPPPPGRRRASGLSLPSLTRALTHHLGEFVGGRHLALGPLPTRAAPPVSSPPPATATAEPSAPLAAPCRHGSEWSRRGRPATALRPGAARRRGDPEPRAARGRGRAPDAGTRRWRHPPRRAASTHAGRLNGRTAHPPYPHRLPRLRRDP